MQHAEGRVVGKILKLYEDARKGFARRCNELVNKPIVSRATQSFLAHAYIIRIVQQRFVVGAHVQHHGQTKLWMHASASRIERQLAHWDAHTVGTASTRRARSLASSPAVVPRSRAAAALTGWEWLRPGWRDGAGREEG